MHSCIRVYLNICIAPFETDAGLASFVRDLERCCVLYAMGEAAFPSSAHLLRCGRWDSSPDAQLFRTEVAVGLPYSCVL